MGADTVRLVAAEAAVKIALVCQTAFSSEVEYRKATNAGGLCRGAAWFSVARMKQPFIHVTEPIGRTAGPRREQPPED